MFEEDGLPRIKLVQHVRVVRAGGILGVTRAGSGMGRTMMMTSVVVSATVVQIGVDS